MRKLLFPICGALFLLLTGCSEPTKTTEKKKEEKLDPATGQSAFTRCTRWPGRGLPTRRCSR